jgi:hypothetical protein
VRWRSALASLTLRAAVAALFLFVASCGGSSSSTAVSGPIVPATPREGLKFGYWTGDPLYLIEQCDHVNTWWARADGAPAWHLAIAAQLQAARGCGIKNIVLHLSTEDPVDLRFQLGRLSEGGWLAGWDSIAAYKLDEPNAAAGGSLSDQEVTDRVMRIRQVMFDVPGLLGAKIGVFYNCAVPGRPGILIFDLVGCFRYGGDGCARLESDYAELRARKKSSAQLWEIPSGALINGKEGRQDPACWASYAHRNLDVWGIVAFMWQGGADPRNTSSGSATRPTCASSTARPAA